MIQTGTLIHPSQPSLKWSTQTLIIGLQGSQQDTARTSGWMQLLQNTLITVPSDPGIHPQAHAHTSALTSNTHLHSAHFCPPLHRALCTLLRVWTNTHKPNKTYTWVSIVLTVCLLNRHKNNPKVERQGESVPQSDSRGRQTGSGELSITSYYSHRQSGLLRCFKRWPWRGCITT